MRVGSPRRPRCSVVQVQTLHGGSGGCAQALCVRERHGWSALHTEGSSTFAGSARSSRVTPAGALPARAGWGGGARTRFQEDASSRSLVRLKTTRDMPSVGGASTGSPSGGLGPAGGTPAIAAAAAVLRRRRCPAEEAPGGGTQPRSALLYRRRPNRGTCRHLGGRGGRTAAERLQAVARKGVIWGCARVACACGTFRWLSVAMCSVPPCSTALGWACTS